MKTPWMLKTILVLVLAGGSLAVGCGNSSVEGTYKDSEGAVTLELKGGKASLNAGMVRIDGAYTVDGNKVTIRPTEGADADALVFTIDKDGSLDPPPGGAFTKLGRTK